MMLLYSGVRAEDQKYHHWGVRVESGAEEKVDAHEHFLLRMCAQLLLDLPLSVPCSCWAERARAHIAQP